MSQMTDKTAEAFVHEELARQFYRSISTAAGNGHSRVIIDFSRVRPQWEIQLPTMVSIPEESAPPVIDLMDLVAKTLPGLWGYVENAGGEKIEVCTRCRKCFDKKTGAELKP